MQELIVYLFSFLNYNFQLLDAIKQLFNVCPDHSYQSKKSKFIDFLKFSLLKFSPSAVVLPDNLSGIWKKNNEWNWKFPQYFYKKWLFATISNFFPRKAKFLKFEKIYSWLASMLRILKIQIQVQLLSVIIIKIQM